MNADFAGHFGLRQYGTHVARKLSISLYCRHGLAVGLVQLFRVAARGASRVVAARHSGEVVLGLTAANLKAVPDRQPISPIMAFAHLHCLYDLVAKCLTYVRSACLYRVHFTEHHCIDGNEIALCLDIRYSFICHNDSSFLAGVHHNNVGAATRPRAV